MANFIDDAMTKTPDESTETPASLDLFLDRLAFGCSLHFESGLCGDWILKQSKTGKPAVHLVTKGDCWVTFPGFSEKAFLLKAGDAIFFTRSNTHWLSSDNNPDQIKNEFKNQCVPEHLERGLVCYDIEVDSPDAVMLFDALPDWLILPASDQAADLKSLIELIQQETSSQHPGYKSAISRISDVIVLKLLRQLLLGDIGQKGVLAALTDRQLNKVVMAIQENPELEWSVEKLASIGCLSRSAFAARCHEVCDVTPKTLVNEIRLQLARRLLVQTELSLEQIADRVGYQSATSFIRFFKQGLNTAPGEYRKQQNGVSVN